ncbi:MAG: glycosyltransferase family 2 protein [Nitrospinae bacterium]|jgi:dolichol-phosphate mannosyltransferase|nr:glycosyltransferase family 2 protein [Nitrospinota bacterium]MDA1108263.1 glycosyltransferase family 2 protein [Nitrospinota bacterium]
MSQPQPDASLDLSVVIPIYNERENLVALEERLNETLQKLDFNYEVVFVDDGSLDGSDELIRTLQKHNPHLRLIRFAKNFGQSAAFVAGFRTSRGRIIVTMDADLQNDPADIPALLEKIKEFDVVCGWRHKRNDPWIKKISSKVANAVRNQLSDETIADTGCSLKAFRRECFDNIILFNGMHRFFPTLIKMEGFSVTQVKVSHHPRLHGKSKYNIRNRLWSSLKDLFGVRWLKKRRLNYYVIEEE